MNNNFIEIKIDPNYIQFPIVQNGEEVYAMKYPRNIMIMSNNKTAMTLLSFMRLLFLF